MADEPTPPNTPPASDPPAKTWDEVLAGMDAAAKAAYEQHTGGLKSALEKEREAAKQNAERIRAIEAERQQAEEKRLAEQGEFKTLAEKRAEELAAALEQAKGNAAEVEKAKAAIAEYDKVIESLAEKQIKDLNLPKAVADLLSGKSPLERLRWFEENAKDLKGAGGLLPPSPHGDRNGKVDPAKALANSPRTF